MTAALWLAVKVIMGSKVLFPLRIVQCEEEQSFGQLLFQLGGEQFVEKRLEGVRIEGEGGKHYKVQLDAPLKLCSTFCCKAIEYSLEVEALLAPISTRSVSEVLMSS